MHYIKELALIFAPVVFAWFLMFLLGAFVSASWNIAEWEAQTRIFCAIWSSIFGGAVWYRLRTAV